MPHHKPRASLYAVIGAGDLVVERIRATAAHVEGGSVSTDWRELPVQATASAQVMLAQALDVAAGTYTGLVERGEQLVTRIRNQQSTRDAVAQTETAVIQTKSAGNAATNTVKKTARKTSRTTTTRAKAAGTSAKKAAERTADAVSEAADKIGDGTTS